MEKDKSEKNITSKKEAKEPKLDVKEEKSSKKRERSRSKSKEKSKPENTKKYPEFPQDETKIYKIIHWNIAGLRPFMKKGELDKLIKEEDPDIICFNEIKMDNELIKSMNIYNQFETKYKFKSYWYCPTEKKGYSGTGVLTKYEPISVNYGMNIEKHDKEGRIITLEYDKFYVICCYTPNAGEGLKRLDYRVKEWDKDFFEYINSLKSKKDIILTGDLNVAKDEMDIFDPKGKEKLPGFTKMERESFSKFLDMGYIDTFRNINSKEKKYTFFSKRTKGKESNKGWRLDYFITNKEAKNVIIKDSNMADKDKYDSSDHIPIIFTFCLN